MPPTPRPRRPFARTLTARAVLTTCVAAFVSVLVTAAIALPLTLRAANTALRDDLADKAAITAYVVSPKTGQPVKSEAIIRELRREGIDVYLIRNGKADRTGLPASIVTAVADGNDVTDRIATVGGRRDYVEGRAFGDGYGVVLVQRVLGATASAVLPRIGLALLVGLLAGALAGAVLAGRMARPIRNAAIAANRLSAGDRTVRVPLEPPAEVEDVSRALNRLAEALTISEGRQRDFLLSISHELRTPLTSLKGYAEALADGVIGEDAGQRAGQTMLTEAGNLERLINDLLALARLEAAEFPLETAPVELIALAGSVVEAWAGRVANAGLVLRTEIPAVPVIVHTDPGRLRQVIDGLLENALRVVPAGAPLVLAVRGPHPGAPDWGFIEVRDGGPGFTDADLAVVFERGALYERYRGVRKVGSGLGLALAAGLVRRLGGGIEAGHATEGGARFTVAMPTLAATRAHR